jgi:hypothetical protein
LEGLCDLRADLAMQWKRRVPIELDRRQEKLTCAAHYWPLQVDLGDTRPVEEYRW